MLKFSYYHFRFLRFFAVFSINIYYYFLERGWTHRNMGLEYIRKHYKNYHKEAVVYFADDDNSYDVRLFDKYIRKVKTIGVWPVGRWL